MNKTLLSTALVATMAAVAFAPTAQAADGTITITGSVVAQSCQVESTAFGTSAAKTVALPLVLTSALASAGVTANKTPFTLAISGCNAALTSVQTSFSGADIDSGTGNLTNEGTATNVQIQLLNGSDAVMPLNGANATAQNSQVVTLSNGAATMSYAAQYIAVGGAAGVGSVSTSVEFTMIYL